MNDEGKTRCARGTIGDVAMHKTATTTTTEDVDAGQGRGDRGVGRGGRGVGVRVLRLREMTIGDVVRVMRESEHETFPTSDNTMISVRGVFDVFVKAVVDGLTKPEEPSGTGRRVGETALAESSTAETVGLIKLPPRATTIRTTMRVEEPTNVLEELYNTPATALSETSTPLVECAPDVLIADVAGMLDERDVHAVFTTTFDGERAIVTAEDILRYLCPIQDALREVATFDTEAFNALFRSPRDTFLAVRQEHNMDLTTADVMWWMHEQNVNAVAFFESTFRVPGDQPLYGSVFVELSTRDLLDVTPDNFHTVFETDPVAYIAMKRAGVFVQSQTIALDAHERGARDSIAALAEKNPPRLPKRFYIFQRDVVRAMTPLSLLRVLVAAHARS